MFPSYLADDSINLEKRRFAISYYLHLIGMAILADFKNKYLNKDNIFVSQYFLLSKD